MRSEVSVGPLRDSERPAAVRVLARAFRDNPLNLAVIRQADPARRLRSNVHGMRALLAVAVTHGQALGGHCEGRLVGALVATPPHAYPLPPPPLLARLRCLAGQGFGVARRWSAVFDAVSALHPAEPHYYLGTLGVDPEHQGRGVGSALLWHWLGSADRADQPAYLETDSAANLPFYARAGFEVTGELCVLGVRVWRLRRPAGSRASRAVGEPGRAVRGSGGIS